MTSGEAMPPRKAAGYFGEFRRQPMLNRREEMDLARRSMTGDPAAAARLITSHLRFVLKVARAYRNSGLPMNDLVQEGTIGLIHAVRRFNPDRDVRLATYARWWIRAAIQEYVVRSWSLVRVSTTAAQKALFLRLRRMTSEIKDGTEALNEDLLASLAKRFGVPIRDVATLARRASGLDYSLNAPVANGAREDWIDRLPDDRSNPEERVTAASQSRFWRRLLGRALDMLPPREQVIIQKRYLAEASLTLEALGRELGISKERVRQLEARALDKLRDVLVPARSGEDLTV